jgi:hypothetical protein
MAVAMREPLSADTAERTWSRADLRRALARLEEWLHREGRQIRALRAAGEDVRQRERVWHERLRQYERLATLLRSSAR